MKVVIQRVSKASVTVENEKIATVCIKRVLRMFALPAILESTLEM